LGILAQIWKIFWGKTLILRQYPGFEGNIWTLGYMKSQEHPIIRVEFENSTTELAGTAEILTTKTPFNLQF
jgi:hypothetical protein